MNFFDYMIRHLPNHILLKVLPKGTVEVDAGAAPANILIAGTNTEFQSDYSVGDTVVIWNYNGHVGHELTVTNIVSNLQMYCDITEDTIASGLNYFHKKRKNVFLDSIFIVIHNILKRFNDTIGDDFRESWIYLWQQCREWRLYPGGWETANQLSAFLQTLWDVHRYRGTTGDNMTDFDSDSYGIKGECDRISNNPGFTELEAGVDICWCLAGDIEHEFDPVTGQASPDDSASSDNLLWRYPDFTLPTTTHPLGEYDPANAVCFLSIFDAMIIEITNNNEENYSEREIRRVVREITPLDVPYLLYFS